MSNSHDPLTPALFRPHHVELDISPLSCSTDAGVSRHVDDIRKTLERVIKYAMLELDTPVDHPAIVHLINATTAMRQSKAILDGPPMVAAPAGGPQLTPRGGGRPH
jgi:hypothetical protein